MKMIIKLLALGIYYSIAIRFPTQPVPGWWLGYALRRFLLKRIAESCGEGVHVKHGCYIGLGRKLRVGNGAQLGHNARIESNVTIGDDVLMGPDVVIMTTSHAFENPDLPINRQGSLPTLPVVIGNDAWIGTRVVIMPGVTIGNGAVVGAGSIVTRDIPPFAIAAGNPARVIRQRGSRFVQSQKLT